MSTERADYLDTQTLDGPGDYFHTENDAVDTSKPGPGATPLVIASQGGQQAPRGTTAASGTSATLSTASPHSDGFEARTNADLTSEAKRRGLQIPKGANKAALVALLRGQ